MLNSKQRAQLRGMANSLDAIFQIGKGGINDQLIRQVDETLEVRELIKAVSEALEKRELIKISVLETADCTSREAADEIASKTKSDVVQVIGRKFILYRESKDNKQIVLVKK